MDPGQIIHRDPRQMRPHQPLPLEQPLHALFDGLRLHGQELGRGANQPVLRQKAVPRGQIVLQLKEDSGLHPPGIVSGDPQRNGEPIHRPEGGLQGVIHQKVRVIVQ